MREYTRNESHAKRFKVGDKVQFKSSTGKTWLTKELWVVTGHVKHPQDKNFNDMWDSHIKLSDRKGFTMKVCMHPESCSSPHVKIDPNQLRFPKYKPNGKLSPK